MSINMSMSQTPTLNLNNYSHLLFLAHTFHKLSAIFYLIKSTMAYELQLGSTINVIIL